MSKSDIKIALAGNPNCGKTTLFNALTGSNQYVGNWPGVTVEKKEGKFKNHNNVTIMDLPGIYSLSPYTLEEVVARNYLIDERPDAILNIIDGTNIERNLYLTTQLTEIGIPVVVAINMMDVVNKNGDTINTDVLSKKLGCKVVEISALKGTGIIEATEAAVEAAKSTTTVPMHIFSGAVEHAIAHIEEAAVHDMPEEQQRWYAIKIFERDEKVMAKLQLDEKVARHIESDIKAAERELDDDAESIVINERYVYITSIIDKCVTRKNKGKLTTSDKIDRVVTNRILGLPIFVAIMFIVYYISISTVGGIFTDWVNDGAFGDGWHLFTIGAAQYEEATKEFTDSANIVNAFVDKYGTEELAENLDTESEDFDSENAKNTLNSFAMKIKPNDTAEYTLEDEETLATENVVYTADEFNEAIDVYESYDCTNPDPANYGIWVPSIPVLIKSGLDAINCADWLQALILDGIISGVGSVLGFVPQIFVLFIFLAFLESCGYMTRVAFVLDRIFRKFGLSGKSFIPLLIGSGCGVPGIMASRTIENEQDRRMTIITTTFIPCSAKLPIIAMLAAAVFNGAWWVGPSAYFVGIVAIIVSGIMLKKTKMFSGDTAPFVMELPAYHMPTVGTILSSMWERGWSFIKKAGTIILLATVIIWFTSVFGWVNGTFTMLTEEQMDCSILAIIGNAVAWLFAPIGWGNWQSAVATITGFIAKENIVGTMGVLYGNGGISANVAMGTAFTALSGYSFLVFNLLCAPCFAAMGAIRREMNSTKWFFRAIGYQCGFAYLVSAMIYQFGSILSGTFTANPANIIGLIIAVVALVGMIYMLFRPYKDTNRLKTKANA
ncbi:MAG: ferrous iron transport protein B [Ruminococcus sp.]|nr:ferrous iron transport protein B [Ruminococcus sp.]